MDGMERIEIKWIECIDIWILININIETKKGIVIQLDR